MYRENNEFYLTCMDQMDADCFLAHSVQGCREEKICHWCVLDVRNL